MDGERVAQRVVQQVYLLPVRLKCACCAEWLEIGDRVTIDYRNRTVCINREECEARADDKHKKYHKREPRTAAEWLTESN